MNELKTIFITDYMEAQIIKGKLESEGIPVLLAYESVVIVYGFTADGLGKVEIKVPIEFEEEAIKIINEIKPIKDE